MSPTLEHIVSFINSVFHIAIRTAGTDSDPSFPLKGTVWFVSFVLALICLLVQSINVTDRQIERGKRERERQRPRENVMLARRQTSRQIEEKSATEKKKVYTLMITLGSCPS